MTCARLDVYLSDTARSALDAAGVRLGIPTASVVELLANHAYRLGKRDLGRLPEDARGRKGMGRRKTA